tara:strand:- start:1786 stop:2988 length:1203 start_codon:yes stop_codon:yes gene_type:complete
MVYLVLIITLVGLGVVGYWVRKGATPAPVQNIHAVKVPNRSSTASDHAGTLTSNRSRTATNTPPKLSEANVRKQAQLFVESVRPLNPRRVMPASLAALHLYQEKDLSDDVQTRLATLTNEVPRPKSIMLRLVAGKDDPVQLSRLISTDPGSTALLLRTVNSAQFNLSHKIDSIQRAITYLGSKLVKDIVLSNIIKGDRKVGDREVERLAQKFWLTSYIASSMASLAAQQLRYETSSSIATQSLLFSIGDITLLTHIPELKKLYLSPLSFTERVQAIQDELGFNSAITAAVLARAWKLPDILITGLANSLAPLTTAPEDCAIEDLAPFTLSYACYRLADHMIRERIADIGEAFELLTQADEYYYLKDYLEVCKLQFLGAILTAPLLASKIRPLTASLARAM